MSKKRASKGFQLPPATSNNIAPLKRNLWLKSAEKGFVQPSVANKEIYKLLLAALWPEGKGIPGPALSETELRAAVDAARGALGKPPYKDVFRRLRELQGDEGFTCIVKEGVKYQLQHLTVGPKRPPRETLAKEAWARLKETSGRRCTHCGAQEPDAKLSPDHRVPRLRGGTNEEANLQPFCEQCNNLKSSACSGCMLNCYTCPWAFPEVYKPIVIGDDNREQLRRVAQKLGIGQSELADKILRDYFNKNPATN